MIFNNIYKNTVTFTTNDNVEFRFTDNKSEIRYLLDIIIDNNITISNVVSIGTFKNIGTIVNNSTNTIGIDLESTKVILVLSGTHTVNIKIKQGIFIGVSNSISVPSNFITIPIGYSFDDTAQQIMTNTNKLNYIDNYMTPMENEMLLSVNQQNPLLIGINSLLDSSEALNTATDLYSPYSHDNNTYPMFAYTNKLFSNDLVEADPYKNKQISYLIDDASIPSVLFINTNISKIKLGTTVQDSINLTPSILQNIYTNNNIESKTNGNIDLNLSDLVKTMKKDNVTRYSYETDTTGLGTIDYDSIDIQSKILNPYNDGKAYFITYLTGGEYGFENLGEFFKKENLVKLGETTLPSDSLLNSSAQTKSLLFNKVDDLTTPFTITDDDFMKFNINTQGQAVDGSPIESSDLSDLLGSNYKRSNVSAIINTNRSTIFFI